MRKNRNRMMVGRTDDILPSEQGERMGDDGNMILAANNHNNYEDEHFVANDGSLTFDSNT